MITLAQKTELATTERELFCNGCDGCIMVPSNEYGQASDHRYRYSMGVGHAWSLHTLRQWESFDAKRHDGTRKHDTPQARQAWIGGTAYNYGIGKAHYPVPALYQNTTQQPHAITDCNDLTYVAWFNSL